MSTIFNFIDYNSINFVDNYDTPICIHTFTDVTFRTENSNYLNFYTSVGMCNNKIISITNKQFSFLVQKYIHFLGDQYAYSLQTTCQNIINTPISNIIKITEPVFLFFDYESINGTGHSYDLMFYLLYHYISNNCSAKLLVVKTDNNYYNITLSLIQKYFNIEYLYINENTTYMFSHFLCVRTYQNILFNNVKEFINKYLIQKIIDKYDQTNSVFFDSVIKIKPNNSNNLNSHSVNIPTHNFRLFCKNKNIFDLNTVDEDYKIYLLNKATNIIVSGSSNYYININYYLNTTVNKFISIIYNENMRHESDRMFVYNGKYYTQHMPGHYCANIIDQIYNSWTFYGESVIIKNLDDYVVNTKLNDIIPLDNGVNVSDNN